MSFSKRMPARFAHPYFRLFPFVATLILQGCSAYSPTSSQQQQDPVTPTTPSSLVATAASGTQVNLAWGASTDKVGVTGYRVERCSGAGCSSFAQIAMTTSATAYTDSGVTSATSYSYRVRAADAAGNLSSYSNISSVTTHDTTPPSTPSSLVATASSSSQIGLTWTASTDNVGVAGYRVERCSGAGCSSFAQVGTTGGTTTFSDSGLSASTSYSYRVRATDAAGNLSGYSNTAPATTPAGTDTTHPSAPTNLAATATASGTQINLSWTASTDNVGVTGYKIERCAGAGCSSFAQIGTTTTATTYADSGLTSATSYSYRVRATDTAGNLSNYSNVSSATTPDTVAPTAPTNLKATASSSSQIGLTWTASTDNVAVTGYKVERCSGAGCSSFAQIATTGGTTTFSDSGLNASTSYSYRVRATDAVGNLSGYSNTASATTSSSGGSSITVSVSPRRGGLPISQELTSLAATLTNDTANQGVSWSFTSTGSSSGGGFSATTSTSGVAVTFTAPTSPGVVTITATSLADGSKTATATIGITDLHDVATYLNGNSRQGANEQEYALATSGPTAVNSTNFGKLFSCGVDAAVYAQPLWVANVANVSSGGTHNVVYVATQHNTVYAFDADNSGCQNMWGGAKNLNPAGQTWVTSGDVACTDLQPHIGIVGTPVIDTNSKTIYLVTKSKTTSGTTTFHQLLHALDLATGAEKFSGPMEIAATASGNGNGSVGGVLTFDASTQNQRPALLLTGGHIIISWASHCDNGPYHGWVMSYGAASLAQESVLNLSPAGDKVGVWMSGDGPAADASGNIYFATGNGSFNADASGHDYGDVVLKLGPPSGGTFPVLSYFRSFEQEPPPDGADNDQGSGGAMLLPTANSKSPLVQAGKDGRMYLLDQSSLGGTSSTSNNIMQEVSGQLPGGVWSSPTYWNGNIYYGPALDGSTQGAAMRAFSFNAGGTGLLGGTPSSTTATIFTFPGPTPPISASSTSNGIVWALDNSNFGGACPASSCQVLYGYDATNLGTQLYNSTQASGNRDQGGGAVKFAVPTVANGKVYVGGQSTLTVYGLLP